MSCDQAKASRIFLIITQLSIDTVSTYCLQKEIVEQQTSHHKLQQLASQVLLQFQILKRHYSFIYTLKAIIAIKNSVSHDKNKELCFRD